MIKTILIFLALSSNVFAFGLLNQMDAGSTPSAGTCDCEENKVDEGSTTNALYDSGGNVRVFSQSFVSQGSGTSVKITLRADTTYSYPIIGTTTIYLDDDRDFTGDLLGSATTTIPDSNTEFCTEITSSTSLSAATTYYFAIRSTTDYTNRFTITKNDSEYSSGTFCESTSLDHTSGATCTADRDLYFDVCVGTGCSCD